MKNKLSTLLILLFALVLMSCESDDDSASINGEVNGEWNIESINYTGSTVTSAQGNSITSNFTGESFDENATLIFNADNTFTSQGSYSIELETTTLGQTQNQSVPIDNYSSEGEWSLSGNILTIEGELVSISSNTPTINDPNESAPQDLIIEELTDTTMVVSSVTQQTIVDSGVSINVNLDSTITFTKP